MIHAPRPAGGTAFHLRDVHVRYDGAASSAVKGIDLEVAPGEAVGIVGPSGAGKSTLLRLLNGTVRASAGSVEVDGVALATCPAARLRTIRARLAWIPQELALVPNLRAVSNVLSGAFGRRSTLGALRSLVRPTRDELRQAHALLDRVGIAHALFTRVDRLSGGERQRVAIARALYQEPGALLADEPVASVDPARARDTMQLLLDVGRECGLTLIASLHDLELARATFPRLIGLREGRILFDRATAQLDDATFAALYRLVPGSVA